MESREQLADPAEAAAALAALREGREAMAERVRPPWWYDAGLGISVFLFLAQASLRDVRPWQFVVLGVALILLWALVAGYRRRTGVWVDGLRRGRTGRTFAAWLPAYAVVYALAAVAEFGLELRGAMAVGGAVLGVVLVLVSRWWMRLYAEELRETP